MAKTAPSEVAASSELLEKLVDRIELRDIHTLKLSGERMEIGSPQPAQLLFELDASYRFVDSQLHCRFVAAVPMRDAEEELVARLDAIIALEFSVTGDEPEPSREVMDRFLNEYGLVIVFPFMREAIQSASSRVGLGPVTFGLYRHHDNGFRAVSVRSSEA